MAQNIVGLTAANQLVSFSAAAPGSASAPLAVTGLQPGESLLGIDFRPATGQLYALGSSNRLYTLNRSTGSATPVGSGTFAIPLNGSAFGFDFNPTVDRIRVVSNAEQNLRLHPDTGAVVDADMGAAGVQPDGALAYAGGAPADPSVAASAYTNNDNDPATNTTLYGIDSADNSLVIQNPANSGQLSKVGPLGLDVNDLIGFDVFGVNQAYAGLTDGAQSRLYRVNLGAGGATLVGTIGSGLSLRGLAVESLPRFEVFFPGFPESKLTLVQGTPPVAEYDFIATFDNNERRIGSFPLSTLSGVIISAQVSGAFVEVATTTGTYRSRNGFIYSKVGP
jgi:hypothetical protein